MKDEEKAVLDWIDENFEPGSLTIEDFPLFPFGKRIIDKNGGEMVVFYDLLTGKVKHVLPDKKKGL